MERKVAVAKLVKLLGKGMGYRVDLKAPTKEEREAARASLSEVCAKRKELEEKKTARYKAILAADVEYQTLFAEHKAVREVADRLLSITGRHKFTVGKSNSLFFHVMAEGDSWEEVIAKLEKEKQHA